MKIFWSWLFALFYKTKKKELPNKTRNDKEIEVGHYEYESDLVRAGREANEKRLQADALLINDRLDNVFLEAIDQQEQERLDAEKKAEALRKNILSDENFEKAFRNLSKDLMNEWEDRDKLYIFNFTMQFSSAEWEIFKREFLTLLKLKGIIAEEISESIAIDRKSMAEYATRCKENRRSKAPLETITTSAYR